ncbi:ATP-binding protein [Streptomyces sp. NPDC003996]
MHTPLFPPPGPMGTDEFTMSFTSTPRGARLARLFVSHCLDSWGHPYDGDVNETLTLITAELCANAVRHGRVPGRDFHVRLTSEAIGELRLEVSDTRGERRPTVVPPAGTDAESGRGLRIVTALADEWGVPDRRGGPGETVWARVSAASSGPSDAPSPVTTSAAYRFSAEPCASDLARMALTRHSDDVPRNAKHERDVSGPARPAP